MGDNGLWWLWIVVPMLFIWGPWRRRFHWRHPWNWEGRSRGDTRRGHRGPVADELAEALEAQRAVTEQLEQRVAELESRLDFTERLLAERREADRVPLLGS